MAVTKIWDVKGWLSKLLIYIENPEKTRNPHYVDSPDHYEDKKQEMSDLIDYAMQDERAKSFHSRKQEISHKEYYVSGVNCLPETARMEMIAVKKQYGKEDGIAAYHAIQAFQYGEVSPEIAHEIGVKLAERLWGNRFQVVVSTHMDKENQYHNHFVLNSVSYVDGYKYNDCKASCRRMREVSDDLCREYGLSVIEHPSDRRHKHYGEQRAEREGRPTWRSIIRDDVDLAIAHSMTESQFFYHLRKLGYAIKMGKDITVRPAGRERGVKLMRNFGDNYSLTRIRERILNQQTPYLLRNLEPVRIFARFIGRFKEVKKQKGFRALYFHYLYKMGVLPREKVTSGKRIHFLLRDDLRRLDITLQQLRLLSVNRIDTKEQLFSHTNTLEQKYGDLYAQRNKLRNQSRSIHDPIRLGEVKREISAISEKLKSVRKELTLCKRIRLDIPDISQRLKTVYQDEHKQKEEKHREQRRRRR